MNSRLIKLQSFEDERGSVDVGSSFSEVPFEIKRFFITSATSAEIARGEHAHKLCHQFLVAVNGSITASCDDGRKKTEFLLNSQRVGLYMPPLTWGTQTNFSHGAKLLVLASELYDPDDYISDYREFKTLVQRN